MTGDSNDLTQTRAAAQELDAGDPLAPYRGRFLIPDPALVYLDGNSLGMTPARTPEACRAVVEEQWADGLIRSWDGGWLAQPAAVGDLLGTSLLGAAPGETIVCDNTTTDIYKAVCAALDLRPDRHTIVAHRADFPTDRSIVAEVAARRGGVVSWIGPLTPDVVDPNPVLAADVARALNDDVAVVLLSLVDYRSAAIADVVGITAAAHQAGALVLWDCSHAVGAIPIDLPGWEADLAVGCTYKYLNGGPGAPAWLWVHSRHHDDLGTPALPGWLGDRRPFAMTEEYVPAPGVRRFVTGTTSPLLLACVREGVTLVAEAGVPAIRAKSERLTAYAVELTDRWLTAYGVTLATPRDPAWRGSHVLLRHPEALALCQSLIDGGVVPDYRPPDGIRVGLSPLTTRFTDVHDGLASLWTLLAALAR